MSQKRTGSLAGNLPQSSDFLMRMIGSNNEYSVPSSESDSELWWDSLAAGNRVFARFWSKVNTNGPIPIHRPELGRCWEWTGSLLRGYGQFVAPRDLDGQPHIYAHRFAYGIAQRIVLPPELKTCHHCDRPPCVRPSHLFAGTQHDNLSDARFKGRLVNGQHWIKVSDEGVLDILTNYRPRHNGKALAKKYGITLVSLCRIINGTQRSKRTRESYAPKPQQPLSPLYGPDSPFELVPSAPIEIRGDIR